MNNREKGNKAEQELVNLLKENNKDILVERSPRTMRRVFANGKTFYVSGSCDYFNTFDIMMKKKENQGTSWIQVKTNHSDVSKALKKIRDIRDYFIGDYLCVALRVDRKGWVMYNLDGTKYFFDLKLRECEPFQVTSD